MCIAIAPRCMEPRGLASTRNYHRLLLLKVIRLFHADFQAGRDLLASVYQAAIVEPDSSLQTWGFHSLEVCFTPLKRTLGALWALWFWACMPPSTIEAHVMKLIVLTLLLEAVWNLIVCLAADDLRWFVLHLVEQSYKLMCPTLL